MQKGLSQKYVAVMAPFGLLLLFAFFESALLFLFHGRYPVVSLVFGFVFYFRIFNPQKLNLILVFLLGILTDFLMGYPLGFEALCFLIGVFFVGFYRVSLLRMSFFKQWGSYALTVFGMMLFAQLTLFIFLERGVPLHGFVRDYLALILAYPFMAKVAAIMNQKTGGI